MENKMVEKIIDTIYITGGLVLLMTVIMAMSSCGIKNCCKKTIDEVYKHEGLYIYEDNE